MASSIYKQPWIGKCGTLHFPRKKCKVCRRSENRQYRQTESGKAAIKRAIDRHMAKDGVKQRMLTKKAEYYLKKIAEQDRTSGLTRLRKKMRSHIVYEFRMRNVLRRFVRCFTFCDGFVIYEDKLPELQRLRELASELLAMKVHQKGHLVGP